MKELGPVVGCAPSMPPRSTNVHKRDLTRLVPWDGIMERDLAGEDVMDCTMVELAGEQSPLGLALSEQAPS